MKLLKAFAFRNTTVSHTMRTLGPSGSAIHVRSVSREGVGRAFLKRPFNRIDVRVVGEHHEGQILAVR